MEDERPFVIESPTRIKLRPAAREWARQWGMSDHEMARYLLQQEKLRAAEGERDVMGPELPPQSVNVEEGSMPSVNLDDGDELRPF
jgi:hypothetical protein